VAGRPARLIRRLARRSTDVRSKIAEGTGWEAIAISYGARFVAVQITPVRGIRELRQFVALPFRLHAGTPWIPPLKLERYIFLYRRANAFFTHGEAEYFLARRDGRVVGRITAQVDRAFNEFHSSRWGMFGFLEFEDDPEVLRALLDTAEAWVRSRGMERMVGPMDFQMNDESGVLIEGFERAPMIKQPWHPRYYQARVEEIGLTKAMDLLMYERSVFDPEALSPQLRRIAERARTRYGVTIRPMSRRHLRRELDDFANVYNSAWSRNWGFVPYSKEDLDAYAMDLQLVYSKDWFMVAEVEGRTAAIAITVPDVNQALKKMRGRLLPLGWWYYLRKSTIVKQVRVGFLGVLPEYEHTGVGAALYEAQYRKGETTRQAGGEMGWILETNHSMNRAMEALGGRVVKRFRVYERLLDSSAEPSRPT
jgi:GNAT superfamily N-acetyltransferase